MARDTTTDQIDSLYEVPPAEFVKARNALVKSLKAAGQREAADRAAKLTRPTASVWATNQVARRDAKLVAHLADATEKLQGGVARDKARYAAAINTHRGLLNEVRQRIEAVLHEGGLRDAPATVAAAVQNFRSGLMDERARPLVEGGRLEEDVGLEAGGGVFGLTIPAFDEALNDPGHQTAARSAPQRHGEHAGAAREQERREQERAAAKARTEAERRAHAARKAVDAAETARAKHEAAVAAARAELERAERALDVARGSEKDARSALAAALAVLESLRPRSP